MRRLLKPTLLLWLATGLALISFLIWWGISATESRPQPAIVGPNQQEIAWLAPSTSVLDWDRFVAAVQQLVQKQHLPTPDLQADLQHAHPERGSAIPEVSLIWKSSERRLTFRWYKVTSKAKSGDWLAALMKRSPPPLAVLGGSNSEAAVTLAQHLQQETASLPEKLWPPLLLTNASAEYVTSPQASVQIPSVRQLLLDIYPGHTFRYCFNNSQMARSAVRFIWNHPDLRPDYDPVYLVQWNDDPYSVDLTNGFAEAVVHRGLADAAAEWAWISGCISHGGPIPGLAGGIYPVHQVLGHLPRWFEVPSGVGSFYQPNRYEAEEATLLNQALATETRQRRSLLCVTGQADSSRRFLRSLYQLDPIQSRRLVIALGDVIPFNDIYRDRRILWPVQQLPMPLVFFCHDNPIDPDAGFRPSIDHLTLSQAETVTREPSASLSANNGYSGSSSGTEDILLNIRIIETLALAFAENSDFCKGPDQLQERLHRLHLGSRGLSFNPSEGRLFFEKTGDRHTGTGEHIVCLRPGLEGTRVLPSASLEVWRYQPLDGVYWKQVGSTLRVSYTPRTIEGGIRR